MVGLNDWQCDPVNRVGSCQVQRISIESESRLDVRKCMYLAVQWTFDARFRKFGFLPRMDALIVLRKWELWLSQGRWLLQVGIPVECLEQLSELPCALSPVSISSDPRWRFPLSVDLQHDNDGRINTRGSPLICTVKVGCSLFKSRQIRSARHKKTFVQ